MPRGTVVPSPCPLFIAAVVGLLLVFGAASFALRKSEGGVLGAMHRLFTSGFAMAALTIVLEVFDLGTDSLALWDVESNPRLAAFHTTYALVYGIAAAVSLYALFFRVHHVRRKFVDAGKVEPASADPASPVSVAKQLIADSMVGAKTFVAEFDPTDADALHTELVDGVAIEAAERARRELAAEAIKLREAVEQSRLTVLVLCFEDLTFTCVNLWMMSINPAEISVLLLISSAFNCTMLGLKLPEVKELAKSATRILKSKAVLKMSERAALRLQKERKERRSSSVAAKRRSVEADPESAESKLEAALAELAKKDVAIAQRDAELHALRDSLRKEGGTLLGNYRIELDELDITQGKQIGQGSFGHPLRYRPSVGLRPENGLHLQAQL